MKTPDTREELSAETPEARVLRALQVMERIVESTQPVTLGQLAMRIGIPKATLARIVDTLVANNYLSPITGDRGLMPGPRAVHLALGTIGNSAFKRTCRAVLRTLVQSLGETCNLTGLDGDRVVYIERVETAEPLRFHVEPGSRHPLHCTAGGKLFLSQLSRLERNQLLDRLPLTNMTPSTITDRKLLDAELDRLATKRIGTDNEEFIRGMVGVAVPVLGGNDKIVAAVVCHAATARLGLGELIEFVPKMRAASRQLQGLLDRPLIDQSSGLADD